MHLNSLFMCQNNSFNIHTFLILRHERSDIFNNQNTEIFEFTLLGQQIKVVDVELSNTGIHKHSTLSNMKDFIMSQDKAPEIEYVEFLIFIFLVSRNQIEILAKN